MATISDERLAELIQRKQEHRVYLIDHGWGQSHFQAVDEEISLLTELQSLRSQAGVNSDTPFGHEYVEGVKISSLAAALQGETK